MRLAVSIDLDSLYCYADIYGLPADRTDNRIYDIGLSRFVELMDEHGLKGTLFAVASDLFMGDNAATLAALAARGYEIGNHTLSHDYRLTTLGADMIANEIGEGRRQLEGAVGSAVTGFRAPGYNVNRNVLDAVAKSGHAYDSSVFPCLPYYLTKAAVLGAMKLRGRESRSILGSPRVLKAPLGPYRMDRDAFYKRGPGPLIELPISTTPVLRFPFLGSFLILMGETLFSPMFRMFKAASDLVVLELHGMDFMDGHADALPPEMLAQPDVAVPWEKKRQLFSRVFAAMRDAGEVVTLSQAALEYAREEAAGE